MKVTIFNATDNPTIEEVENLVKSKLGDKYTYKSQRKSNSMAGKILNGSSADALTVIKNAYHRTVVSVETIPDPSLSSGKRTSIYFSDATLAGWLGLLHKEGGFVGRMIIRAIYGAKDEIYDEVEKVVKTNINGQDETTEVGLGSLFKKKQ